MSGQGWRRPVAALLGAAALVTTAVGSGSGTGPAPAAAAYTDIAYARDSNPAHRLDLYLPPTRGLHPLVIYIHGGAWEFGDKSMADGVANGYDSLRKTLTEHGYAVASVNYRFSHEKQFPAQLEDVTAAVAYLRAHAGDYGLATNRFVVAGDSAGGQLALLLALAPQEATASPFSGQSAVRAAVSYYGVTDLSGIFADRQDGQCGPASGPAATSAEGRLVGGDPQFGPFRSVAQAGSPITYADKPGAPVLLFQGTRDCIVPEAQARRLQGKIQAAGGTVELVTVSAGHAWPVFFQRQDLQDDLLAFLERYDS